MESEIELLKDIRNFLERQQESYLSGIPILATSQEKFLGFISDELNLQSNLELLRAAVEKGLKLSWKNILIFSPDQINIDQKDFPRVKTFVILGEKVLKNLKKTPLDFEKNLKYGILEDPQIKTDTGALNSKWLYTASLSDVKNSMEVKKEFWNHLKLLV